MPAGGELRIEATNTSLTAVGAEGQAAGDYVSIQVSDTGARMTAEVQRKIFDPFFTTKEVGKGTGLGLSMIYGFITQSGGRITVASEPGQGSRFRLYLPRAASPAAPEAPRSDALDRATGETVLVVEDEDDLRAITRLLLADLGYRVLEAASGEEALALLGDSGDVDLLLTDVVLAGAMNGLEVAAAARTGHPELRVAFMSGYLGESLEGHAKFTEDTVLIQKPFNRDDLAGQLRRALDAG